MEIFRFVSQLKFNILR